MASMIRNLLKECQNLEQVAGLMSTIDFTRMHPDAALYWINEIRNYQPKSQE